MRLRNMENQHRVYMNPADYQTMLDAAVSKRAEMAMLVMGRMGLRRSEVGIILDEIYESSHPDVNLRFVPIYNKDTTGDTEGKRREAWVPEDVYQEIKDYYEVKKKPTDMQMIAKTPRTVSRDISASADKAVEKTGNEDFDYVTTHDFRAYYATNLLLRQGVEPEIVMELGGWEDHETMLTYLNASFDDVIYDALVRAGVVEGEAVSVETQILEEIEAIKNAILDIDTSAGELNSDGGDQSSLGGFSG